MADSKHHRRLLTLLRDLDFARRWFDFCAATRLEPLPESSDPLPASEVATALGSLGRTVRYHTREQFYAIREPNVVGELGLNLALSSVTAEYILVLKVPEGHIGSTFAELMRKAEKRFGPPLPPDPPYPDPWFRDSAELRQVLTTGFRIYDEIATAVLDSGMIARSGDGPAGVAG